MQSMSWDIQEAQTRKEYALWNMCTEMSWTYHEMSSQCFVDLNAVPTLDFAAALRRKRDSCWICRRSGSADGLRRDWKASSFDCISMLFALFDRGFSKKIGFWLAAKGEPWNVLIWKPGNDRAKISIHRSLARYGSFLSHSRTIADPTHWNVNIRKTCHWS